MKRYVHLVGGEAYGVPHERGDAVATKILKKKLEEWLAAGVIVLVDDQEEEDQ